jgi:uncharacterized protein
MHSVDNHESPIRPAASDSHPDDRGAAVAPTPHTLPRSLLLHLGPGLVVGAAYLALIPAARALGMPSAAAIGAQALLVTGPLMIGILKVSSRRRRPGEPTIALRRVPTVRATLGWAAVIIGAAAAAFVLTRPLTAWLERTLFQAWPDSWKPQLGTAGGYSDSALLWTAVLVLLGSVLIAPVVEEAYFRGFLLPRMPARLGRTAPLAHAVLFAFYHVWTLWLTPTRILAVLPLTYITLRTRSILPAMVAHIVLNLIDVVLIIAVVIRPG